MTRSTTSSQPSVQRTRRSRHRPPSVEEEARPCAFCPVILSAAQEVLRDPEALQTDFENWSDVADELATLTMALQATLAAGQPTFHARPSSPLARELLARLRKEIRQSPHPKAGSYAEPELDAAFERVRQSLDPSRGLDASKPLSGPDGLEVLAEVAHDLRSPMTSIITLAETLRNGFSGEVNDLQRRQLGLIYSAALALSTTASDVIELAHGGDSLAQREPSPFSISEVVGSVLDIVRPMAEEKKVEILSRVEATDRRCGYPIALSRVILNLTTNALKFTDEGHVEIGIESVGPKEVEFAVRDTGKGINEKALETLYQPFRRAHGRSGYCFSGTGLGLGICRRLVRAMGSDLELETGSDWGTRFFFTLELPPAEPPL